LKSHNFLDPIFTRAEVSKILNISSLTLSNREKLNKYPKARRDINNYRIYNLNEVFNLQLLTFDAIDPKPVVSVMYDKGYTDPKVLAQIIDSTLSKRVYNGNKK